MPSIFDLECIEPDHDRDCPSQMIERKEDGSIGPAGLCNCSRKLWPMVVEELKNWRFWKEAEDAKASGEFDPDGVEPEVYWNSMNEAREALEREP